MVSTKGWLLFAALLSLSFNAVVHCQDDVEDLSENDEDIVEKAFLLVRHKIDTVELVQGKNTSVVVEIYNAGNRYVERYCKHSQMDRRVAAACAYPAMETSLHLLFHLINAMASAVLLRIFS